MSMFDISIINDQLKVRTSEIYIDLTAAARSAYVCVQRVYRDKNSGISNKEEDATLSKKILKAEADEHKLKLIINQLNAALTSVALAVDELETSINAVIALEAEASSVLRDLNFNESEGEG